MNCCIGVFAHRSAMELSSLVGPSTMSHLLVDGHRTCKCSRAPLKRRWTLQTLMVNQRQAVTVCTLARHNTLSASTVSGIHMFDEFARNVARCSGSRFRCKMSCGDESRLGSYERLFRCLKMQTTITPQLFGRSGGKKRFVVFFSRDT